MYHLLMNLPVFATLGVVAVLVGPLAQLSIVSGAWVLERSVNGGARVMKRWMDGGRDNQSSRELAS
jgi:hypothetical protein